MGFFNFGRKKVASEVIAVEDLGTWVLSEKEKLVVQENDFFRVAGKMVSDLVEGTLGRIEVLEKIDLKEKVEAERLKMIVLQNLGSYVFYVKKFVKDIECLEKNSVSEFVDGIDFVFSDFWSRAAKHYSRATILIGNELGDTKKIMDGFFRDFGKFVTENKTFIERARVVGGVEVGLGKIAEIEVAKIEAERELFGIRKKIEVFEGDIVKIREKIETVHGSQEYLVRARRILEIEAARERIVSDKVELVRLVDYKGLIGFYHKDAKKMRVIKVYQDSGADALIGGSVEVAGLMTEAGIDSEEFLVKVGGIALEEKKLDEVDAGGDEVEVLQVKIDGVLREIEALSKDEVGAVGVIEKLEGNVLEILEEVRMLLKGIGIEVLG